MSKFIDDKIISTIVNDKINNVDEILKTTVRVSPFGIIGKRTFIVKYRDGNNEIQKHKITDDEYINVFSNLN